MSSIVVREPNLRLDSLLDRASRRRQLGRELNVTDTAALIDVAHGRDALADTADRRRAIRVLADALPANRSASVLSALARDTTAPLAERITAVHELGQLPDELEARSTLLEQTADDSVRVRRAAYVALAQTADRQDLNALTALDEPVSSARPLLAFAQTMAASRAGVDEQFLPPAIASPRRPSANERVRSVELVTLPEAEAAQSLAQFHGPNFGIPLAADVHRLTCGTSAWDLIGNAELGGFAAGFDRLLERPWVVALLALRRPPVSITDTQYVVLSRPSPPVVALQVVRTDGEVAYVGTIEPTDSGLAFSIADADRPQTVPTELTGVIDQNGIGLSTNLVATTRIGLRTTDPTTDD